MVNFTEMCQREPKKSSRSTSRDGVAKPQSWIMEAQRRFGPYPRDRAGLARGLHHCPCGVGAARPRCERQKLTDIDAATGWGLATVQCIAAPISREQRTARLDAVVKLRNRGLTHRAIGDAMGLARRRVAYILRAAGKSRQAMEFS